jgi:hypothetical protein
MVKGVVLMRKHAAPHGARRVFGRPCAINMVLLTELSGCLQMKSNRFADVGQCLLAGLSLGLAALECGATGDDIT